MQKDKKLVIIFFTSLVFVLIFSYFIFKSGITNKVKGKLIGTVASYDSNRNVSDYPVILSVFNSSGETLVNTDVAIIINASSKYKINSFEYSFDRKKWYSNVLKASYGTDANAKIVFKNTLNKTVYIRVKNEQGYTSYYYETKVKIDKEKPTIRVSQNSGIYTIYLEDNEELSKLQYSIDGINFDSENIKGKKIIKNKDVSNYNYIRAVDKAGNISDVINARH